MCVCGGVISLVEVETQKEEGHCLISSGSFDQRHHRFVALLKQLVNGSTRTVLMYKFQVLEYFLVPFYFPPPQMYIM